MKKKIHTPTNWEDLEKKTIDIYNQISEPLTRELTDMYETELNIGVTYSSFPPRIQINCIPMNHIQKDEFKKKTLELTKLVKGYADKYDMKLRYAIYNDTVAHDKKSQPSDWWIPIDDYTFMTLHPKKN